MNEKTFNLRYSAGKILAPHVHQVGLLALGSHLENHGAALPIDTDAKIAAYLALQASLRSGAKFLGVLYAATEYEYVQHGVHLGPRELVDKRLIPTLKSAKENLKLHSIVLVNGHGGNLPVQDYLPEIEKDLGLKIIFNNKIVEIEGPHAGTGELSMGMILGITDESKIKEHGDYDRYPEVGMVGLKSARKASAGIDQGAREVQEKGVGLDLALGKKLLDAAIRDIIHDVQSLIN